MNNEQFRDCYIFDLREIDNFLRTGQLLRPQLRRDSRVYDILSKILFLFSFNRYEINGDWKTRAFSLFIDLIILRTFRKRGKKY